MTYTPSYVEKFSIARSHLLKALCGLIALSAAPAHAAWWWPFGNHGMDYAITVEGVDAPLYDWLDDLHLLDKTKDHPPQTLEDLTREEVTLGEKLRQALFAKGYYDAIIEHRLSESPPGLHYTITLGPRYSISNVRFAWPNAALVALESDNDLVTAGQAVDAEAINAQALYAQNTIAKETCLLSLNVTPLLELNSSTHSAALTYRIEHGPSAHFGPLRVSGAERVEKSVIQRALKWKQGDCYREAAVNGTRTALIGSQLFSSVSIAPTPPVQADGQVPMAIEVKERVPRTLRIGGNYATDQGFGIKLGWEHRNFWGDAEKITIDTVLAEQEQSLNMNARLPGWGTRDSDTVTLASGIRHEDTVAYTAQSITAGATYERRFSKTLLGNAGLGYLLTRTRDERTGSQEFGLISFPAYGEYDTRDNAQDARKGWYAQAVLTPYVNTFDPSVTFFKTQMTGQTYISSEMRGKPTLALRASMGSIYGAPASDLPADLRFYAGGGGSVRGYSYQSLSPRFNGEPVGGGSMLELSGELRLRFTETIGGVAFIDGGNTYASSVPHFTNRLYYGGGAGIRYFSPIGPLRLDVGIPINGKDAGQTGYALYVNIGQAF